MTQMPPIHHQLTLEQLLGQHLLLEDVLPGRRQLTHVLAGQPGEVHGPQQLVGLAARRRRLGPRAVQHGARQCLREPLQPLAAHHAHEPPVDVVLRAVARDEAGDEPRKIAVGEGGFKLSFNGVEDVF